MEIIERKGVIAMNGTPLTLLGNEIKAGQTAPDFTVVNNAFAPVKLSDFKGKKVIVSVFPSIDTGVCATQTRTFNKKATSLDENTIIISVSKDLPFALGRFCGAEGIDRVITCSDFMESEFGKKYGFLIKENMLLARGVVVIDAEGIVKHVEYVSDIINEPDYDKALAALK